ncbi:MAG: hypothetical protein K6E98_08115 [Lachnospiraceae bacterium]|nr:hypothetical protein [Lachnospiraceae bacterium]
MTRLNLIRVMTFLGVAMIGLSIPKAVSADALPCTVMYLEQAKTVQTKAVADLNEAKAALAATQAKVDAFVASGNVTSAEYFAAANELLAAKGNVEAKQQALSSANSFVSDCQSKYAVEDNADRSYKALQDLNVVQAAKLEYDNAQNIANAAAVVVNNTKAAIAAYQVQLATSPAVQAQIDTLNAQLVLQEADYKAKQAVADQKKQVYLNSLNSNYAAYNKSAIDYIYNRDMMRSHTVTDLNNDGVVDGNDYFIGVQYVQDGSKSEPLYRQDHYLEEERSLHPCWHIENSEVYHVPVWVYN